MPLAQVLEPVPVLVPGLGAGLEGGIGSMPEWKDALALMLASTCL